MFEQVGPAWPFLSGAATFALAGATIAAAVRRQPVLRAAHLAVRAEVPKQPVPS
jgi:hypothetical protein